MGGQQSRGMGLEGTGPEVIELFFMKAGTQRQLRAGERIIRQGELSSSVFLVVDGELVLKKKAAKGAAPPKELATRGQGQVPPPAARSALPARRPTIRHSSRT